MLNWFSREDEGVGMERLRAEFGQMLDAGRHVFDIAANAFLGGTDPEVIRKDLFSTDKRINKSERRIRRELVVHATIHGVTHFPGCLVLMSLVKDAERVGDYSKNLFEIMGNLVAFAETNNQTGVQQALGNLTKAQEHVMNSMAEIGGRENRLSVSETILGGLVLNEQTLVSSIEDVDLSELMTDLAQQKLVYESVLRSTSMIMQLNLSKFI